jgi:hypothetical protein
MRRSSAALVFALFLATPLLQLRCAIACAMEDVQESAGACHHHHTATVEGIPAIDCRHDCGEHATTTAILLTNRLLNLDALPETVTAPTVAAAIDDIVPSSFVLSPPGGPPDGLVVPLRL